MSTLANGSRAPLILLAEDNPASAEVTQEILSLLGYRVIVANDGISSVKLAHEHLPDLILMDWHMPGMDGLSATRELKLSESTREIPVVSLTAFAMEQDLEACLSAGAIDHITKPVDFDALPEKLIRYLGPRRVT
jgi:CheY-like chemotaxis protein